MSAPAKDPSHSIDQPGGREHDQVRPTIISSEVTLENNATSKAEYTNTQQGLPVNGYTLVHLTCKAVSFGVYFAEKQQRVSPYIQILSSRFYVD